VGCARYGDGALFHGFEQGGLNLGRGAVDFVGEYEVVEDRPGLKTELAFAFGGVVDFRSG
jgi:hypothetical protein